MLLVSLAFQILWNLATLVAEATPSFLNRQFFSGKVTQTLYCRLLFEEKNSNGFNPVSELRHENVYCVQIAIERTVISNNK